MCGVDQHKLDSTVTESTGDQNYKDPIYVPNDEGSFGSNTYAPVVIPVAENLVLCSLVISGHQLSSLEIATSSKVVDEVIEADEAHGVQRSTRNRRRSIEDILLDAV